MCARIAGEVAAEAIKEEDVSSTFLRKYDELWRYEFEDNLKISFKYRLIFDKLSDSDMNALAEFFENNDLKKLSKLNTLKLFGKHPNLLKLLKDIL